MEGKNEENKVQKTVMVDAVLDRIIKDECKKTNRSYSYVLCKAIRATFEPMAKMVIK